MKSSTSPRLPLIEALESRQLFATVIHGFVDNTFASGLDSPTSMDFAPDGRLFVTEQGGDLRVITKSGTLLPTPFVHVDTTRDSERGLLGVTFDPHFETNHFLYVYYTVSDGNGAHNRVSRFTANGDVALANSETPILNLEELDDRKNHNGGGLHFGPDGKLYVGVGENTVSDNAQTLSNRLGKLLRINTDGSIPTDNPFFKTETGDNREIFAFGLRNPFTFAFQPGTGRLFINDVGAATFEEINEGLAGANYGWPITEGKTSDPRFVSPLLAYGHGAGTKTGAAITGGTFYNPSEINQFPDSYIGDYFYSDLGSGWIRKFDPASKKSKLFATDISAPVDLDVTPDGSLYYLSFGTGIVGRIRSTSAKPPKIESQPKRRVVDDGHSVTFSAKAKGRGTLSFQWQRDGVDIPGATSRKFTLAPATRDADQHAMFRVIVTNDFGSVTSKSARLSVRLPK